MGASNSSQNPSQPGKHTLQNKSANHQHLIDDSFQTSSVTSRTERIESSRVKNHNPPLKQGIQMSQNHSHIESSKSMKGSQAPSQNIDQISLKSNQIQKLNEMLNDEIKEFKGQKKVKQPKSNNNGDQPVRRKKRKRTQPQSVILGIWIGVTLSIIIVLIVIIQINKLSISNESQFSRDFPTWRGIAIWIWYVWILGFDIWMFDRYKIRYREIFKIAPNHYPQAVNIYRIAGLHSTVFVTLFLFYVLDITDIYKIPGFTEEYFAGISWLLFIGFLCLPIPAFSNKGRYFVFTLIYDSITSPFRGVAFPVIWMTDQAVSMAVPLKDLEYTICYYTELDFQSAVNICTDNNRISAVMVVAVSICSIRIIQCLRQGYDKGEYFMTPFFFNSLKYGSTLVTAVLSFQYKLGADSIQAAWILFAIISSIYSFMWDMKMDWDLLQKNKYHPFLRQKLTFGSANVYYLITCGNFVMRLAWIITISPKLAAFLGNANLVFLVTGMIQIFRRGVWNLIRVEKQHLALISKPSKESLLQQKALELEKKLATVENSLNLQIKMMRFFKKFEDHRQNLKFQLQRLTEGNVEHNQMLIEAYTKQFEEEQMNKLSGLMDTILKSDSFLKKKIQDDKFSITQSDKQAYKTRLMTESGKQKDLASEAREAQQKMDEIQQIKAQLKEIENQQHKQQLSKHRHHEINVSEFSQGENPDQK